MSLTLEPSRATSATPAPRLGRPALWVRVALAVALVAASLGVRMVQKSRVEKTLGSGRECPFPLKDIPLAFAGWRGADEKLDSEIARATGATDKIFRIYTDHRTGAKLSVIVLYGPANDVYVHTPENCYPSSGYTLVEGPMGRRISVADKTVPFTSLIYVKGEGGLVERQQVYYTWYYDGRWNPGMPNPKQIVRVPGMFKVHVARLISEQERLDDRDPCQDFLEILMPDIERRLATARDKGLIR